MTHRERVIRTLKCEKIGGRVPHFELVFFLTMEAFGRVHPGHILFNQWGQMSLSEKKVYMNYIADTYIMTAQKYEHSIIFMQPCPDDRWLAEVIREKTGDEYYLTIHGDPTFAIPDGNTMLDFSVQMYEHPEQLHETAKRNVENMLNTAAKLNKDGRLIDGFALCSDYCFNTAPFMRPAQFEEFVMPYLKETIAEYRKMGYYSIKHTDGNVMPILRQIADCKPDAIHSLDPQGGVSLREARKIVGDRIALIGNVNCGLLQTGTEEKCDADVLRALREGMEDGFGYIFSTSNCAYTGLPLERYERMWRLWKEHGVYPET